MLPAAAFLRAACSGTTRKDKKWLVHTHKHSSRSKDDERLVPLPYGTRSERLAIP